MRPRSTIVLDSVLHVMRPLVRLLLRNGLTYPTFIAALKKLFIDTAQAELAAQGMPRTDSAVTLLSGVHRRDVRNLTRLATPATAREPAGMASQVVARWMNDPAYQDRKGAPRALLRSVEPGGKTSSFDELVAGISRDVRPRAVLDELRRLGAVREDNAGVALLASGFAPRQGFEELSALFCGNLGDHLAAASMNLQDEANFLEQSVFVDEITEASAQRIHKASVSAWKQAFKTVMQEAQLRFDTDAAQAPPEKRQHRARFGVYFFSGPEAP